MNHEFYQVMVGTPTMSMHGWRQLAKWSIEHSCLKHEEIEDGLRFFGERWESFCEWVVNEYGDYARSLDI